MTTFLQQCGTRYSALICVMDLLDFRDSHILFQTCKLINTRCREQAKRHIQHFNLWNMEGAFTLCIYGQFVRSFNRWIRTTFIADGISAVFTTDIPLMNITLTIERNKSTYSCSVEITPNGIFVNPSCFESGHAVIEANFPKSNFESYRRSLDIFLPALSKLNIHSSSTNVVWVDGKANQFKDLTIIDRVWSICKISQRKLANLIYRLLIALSRETAVSIISRYHTMNQDTEWAYTLLGKFMNMST